MRSLIVLAAGKSTRMRGRNKLLIKIDRKPMIRGVVEAALRSKADEVIVVLGWEANKIQVALDGLPCRLVLNKHYEKGQSGSVKAGLRDIGETTQAILVLPGDMAKIDSQSINRVINEQARKRHLIVIAAHDGKQGHPILFDRELFNEIRQIDEKTYGLKAIVERHAQEIRLVETGSSNVLKDVDMPEDLKKL